MKHITKEEYAVLKTNSESAKELLEDDRFEFFRSFIRENKNYIEATILNNSLRDVDEEATISDKLKKIFHTPKKDQLLELTGKYKFLNEFWSFLNGVIETKKNADDLIARRRLAVKVDDKDING